MSEGFDPAAHREASLSNWEAAAAGWSRNAELVRAWLAPVSHWMVEAVALQPGERVLELAAGLGETGLLAAELVAPGGGVLISDQAEAMLDGARARANELGIANVEFKVLNAEWIDLPLASVDAVLCRFGYMLMTDAGAALAETRRVLRPGAGRLALAVWDAVEANPWFGLFAAELRERSEEPAGGAAGPGPFSMSSPEAVVSALEDAGFTVERLEALELTRRHASFEELWDVQLDMSRMLHDAVLSRPEGEIEEICSSLRERFAPFTAPDGTLEIPGRVLLARADA
ncbi:MAG TPA: methyltransferase domain-containing protein [Solirubrobacteraceae bacterium]|nr:methyltransferase domain-containing protein [Solirubrobacteraceae bacterium]